MGFGNLKSDSGLTALNTWLTDKSYITGFEPSQDDAVVFVEIDTPADATKYPNVARWHKHIATYDTKSLPGNAQVDILTLGPETVAEAAAAAEDDDDVDLFGSDDEEVDEEAERVKAQRLAEYNAKKAKKPKTIAKSIVTLEVKPWDDETDLDELLANVKAIEMDGLVWGASQWIPVGYGIKKLQINLVVEDEKVSLSDLQELIEEDEDHVQSTDVAAMQKL